MTQAEKEELNALVLTLWTTDGTPLHKEQWIRLQYLVETVTATPHELHVRHCKKKCHDYC